MPVLSFVASNWLFEWSWMPSLKALADQRCLVIFCLLFYMSTGVIWSGQAPSVHDLGVPGTCGTPALLPKLKAHLLDVAAPKKFGVSPWFPSLSLQMFHVWSTGRTRPLLLGPCPLQSLLVQQLLPVDVSSTTSELALPSLNFSTSLSTSTRFTSLPILQPHHWESSHFSSPGFGTNWHPSYIF